MEQSDRLLWNHTAHLLATLLNVNRDLSKGKPIEPHQLHPYMSGKPKRKRKKADKEDLALLKEVFTRKKK